MHQLEKENNTMKLIIKHLETEYSVNNNKCTTILKQSLSYLMKGTCENSGLFVSIIKENEDPSYVIHKAFRQMDIADIHEFDIIIWHALQDSKTYTAFSEIVMFIKKVISENKYNKDKKDYVEKIYDKFSFEQEF